MTHPRIFRHCLAVVAAATCGALAASPAAAATLTAGVPCARYIPSFAGKQWIPVTGVGFTPNTDPSVNSVELRYANGDLGAFAPLAADGSLSTNVFMPSEFISSKSRVKKYTLTATDLSTSGVTAPVQLTLVRAGVDVSPAQVRGNVHQRVRWSTYGAPNGTVLYAHWTFGGRRYATRKVGAAKGPCGNVSRRMSFLPSGTRVRSGTWTVYFTGAKRFKRSAALFGTQISLFRTFG